MSEQSAADVIAAHGKLDGGFRCECGWEVAPHLSIIYREHERHVLAALEAARYAVVKLPAHTTVPGGWRADCLGAWSVGDGFDDPVDPVSAWPDGIRKVAMPDGEFISAATARGLAAALLAAAREADNA